MVDAIILCGGLGHRLRAVVADRPKALAPVGGRTFLEWLLRLVAGVGVRDVTLATGFMGDAIEQAFGDRCFGLRLTYSREAEPLGTGGALRPAAGRAKGTPVLVLNGDSYCRFDLDQLLGLHRERRARATMWLQHRSDASPYGAVKLDEAGRVTRFLEKSEHGPGLINCGVYLIERAVIDGIPTGRPVSLEHEVFPRLAGAGLYGVAGSGVFVDIGTPRSLAEADNLLHEEFNRMQVKSPQLAHGREYLAASLDVQRKAFDACLDQVVMVADVAVQALQRGGKILLCGNGGSAADCQHIATELVCRLSKELDRPAICAISLTTDTSVLTAFSNDSGFEGVFARQVEAHGRSGDILIGISTSGQSRNVVKAVQTARQHGLTTVALTGAGGELANDVDYAVVVPDRETQHVQEALLPLEHLLCDLIERAMYGPDRDGEPDR